MGTAGTDVIAWGAERARVGPWRGADDIAYLTPLPEAPAPSAAFLRRCVAQLAGRGVRRVLTGALAPEEQRNFLAAGFAVHEDLHLLSHDLVALPEPPPTSARLRRAVADDTPAVLAVDAVAFDAFWRLDDAGLRDAVAATPSVRYRVALVGHEVVGYVVTGRAARRGYVQRLAVAPAARRSGVGTALVVDGLRWLRRWRATEALVNTQLGNESALALYERLGFRRRPNGLSVLAIDLA